MAFLTVDRTVAMRDVRPAVYSACRMAVQWGWQWAAVMDVAAVDHSVGQMASVWAALTDGSREISKVGTTVSLMVGLTGADWAVQMADELAHDWAASMVALSVTEMAFPKATWTASKTDL